MASKGKQQQSKLGEISDEALVRRIDSLIRTGNRQLAEVLEHLAEMDVRKLYRQQGCSSMFTYCTERLHLSEGASYKRIKAARLIRRFPALLERIANGKLHLSAVVVLGPVLTEDNHVVLLDQAAHQSRRQVEELAARHAPRTVVRPHLRKLPTRDPSPPGVLDCSSDENSGAPESDAPDDHVISCQSADEPTSPSPAAGRVNDAISPLNGEQYRLHVTVGRQWRDKLLKAQQLSKPGTTMAQVLEQALDLLIEKRMKRRFAATQRPRAMRPSSEPSSSRRSRHVPAPVRRQVAERDGLQCSFVSADGHRCTERTGLELHHHEPFARGGEHTAANISLMCRTHNGYLAEHDYGVEHMQRCVDATKEVTCTAAAPTKEQRPATIVGLTTLGRFETENRRAANTRSTANGLPAANARDAAEQACTAAAGCASGSCSPCDTVDGQQVSHAPPARESCPAADPSAGASPGSPGG